MTLCFGIRSHLHYFQYRRLILHYFDIKLLLPNLFFRTETPFTFCTEFINNPIFLWFRRSFLITLLIFFFLRKRILYIFYTISIWPRLSIGEYEFNEMSFYIFLVYEVILFCILQSQYFYYSVWSLTLLLHQTSDFRFWPRNPFLKETFLQRIQVMRPDP